MSKVDRHESDEHATEVFEGGSQPTQVTGHVNPSHHEICAMQVLGSRLRERAAVVNKDGPLELLDLPMDILKDIVKEVSWTAICVPTCRILTLVIGDPHERPHLLSTDPLCSP